MHAFLLDLRYAVRQLRKVPGFTLTAILTLALGIGANTAIFTLVHGVLLRSLPVADPGGLYVLGDEYNCCTVGNLQGNWSIFSYRFYEEVRDHNSGFAQVAASQTNRPPLSMRRLGTDAPAAVFRGELVSGNYFSTLGVSPYSGRLLSPNDDRAGAPAVAVMSYRAWQKYGLDPSMVGRPISINGIPMTLIGIAPPGFFGDRLESDPPDFWMPISLEPQVSGDNSMIHMPSQAWLYIFGRLRPGAKPSQVQAELTAQLRRFYLTPGNASSHINLKDIDKQVIHLAPGAGGFNSMKDDYQQGLILLMSVSAVILIIACANLANLLLARGTVTRARTALQLAVGASRGRILRAQLAESTVLALVGGAAGLLIAVYATRAMVLIAFRGSDAVQISTSLSWPVLFFTFLVSLATGVIFGVGPAWIASRSDPAEALRGISRGTRDASALPQKSLVILQAALSLVLLTVAGLLTQSLRNLDNQQLGYARQGRIIVGINPRSAGYTQERLTGLNQQLQERFSHLPGVISASISLYTVQQGNNWGENLFIAGRSGEFNSNWLRVGAGYFETIGNPILRGRGIEERDTATSQKVAVINETFAKKYFPNEDPIGKHFGKDEAGHANDYEIVGVAKDAKYGDAADDVVPRFFLAMPQIVEYDNPVDRRIELTSRYPGAIELHVTGDADAFAPQIRRTLKDIDPNLAPLYIRTFAEQLKIQTSNHTLISRLSSWFGALALALASIGLYGVTAYRVARRTGEVGIRMALGANRQDILGLVLRGAFSQIGLGLLIGIPLVFAVGHFLASLLFGIKAYNPLILLAAIAVLGGCALLATLLPARRAASIEPMQALRAE